MHNQQASVIALIVILAGMLSASIFYASHPNSSIPTCGRMLASASRLSPHVCRKKTR
jgi:hypothetical protein